MKHNGLRFYLRIYRKILAQDIKSKMSYRADFIISTIGMIFTNIAGFVSFWILFRNFPSINGWSYYEMLFLYGFSLISLTPVQCLFDNNWSLRMYVYSGDFIKYCFRPINLFFYFQSEVFDIKGLGQLAFGIGTLVYAWAKLGLAVKSLYSCSSTSKYRKAHLRYNQGNQYETLYGCEVPRFFQGTFPFYRDIRQK